MVVELSRQSPPPSSVIPRQKHRPSRPGSRKTSLWCRIVLRRWERVKLLDFGIAKFLDGPVRKTTVGMILGTPLYMSPER